MKIKVDQEKVRAAFAEFATDPCFAESAEVVARGGKPVEMLQAMAMLPNGLHAMSALCQSVYPGGPLSRTIQETIIIRVALWLHCQFCSKSHMAICQQQGIDWRSPQDDQTAMALLIAQCVTERNGHATPSDWTFWRRCLSDEEILAVIALACLINGLARFNNTLDVQYNGEYWSA